MPADTTFDQQKDPEDEGEEDSAPAEGASLDELLELLGEGPNEEGGEEHGCVLQKALNLTPLRQKGVKAAGYRHLAKMKSNPEANT